MKNTNRFSSFVQKPFEVSVDLCIFLLEIFNIAQFEEHVLFDLTSPFPHPTLPGLFLLADLLEQVESSTSCIEGVFVAFELRTDGAELQVVADKLEFTL